MSTVPSGLAGHESQGRGRATHPIVGGSCDPSHSGWVVHLSHRVEFGRCSDVPVITASWCSLVHAVWRRDGVCPKKGDSYPFSPSGVSGACLSLSGLAYLMEPDFSPLPPRDRDGGEVDEDITPSDAPMIFQPICKVQ
jgi:hypothetical protein